ncbi:MAG: enolase C-terminal domain-like protein [Eubacteriales bacterium]|nr:enolase C-terminal domain-like protein [Eubacteriales bacterium]
MTDRIKSVTARQLIDCKCRPMVEVDVITENGFRGRGSAPTGSTVGMYESYVLRDGDPSEYGGKSVHRAVNNVTGILGPAIIGMDVSDQRGIDIKMIELDGTENKEKLGGNAIYAVSVAVFRAAAASAGKELYNYIADGSIRTVPVPSFNIINGGKNGGITQAFNEFIIMPWKAPDIYSAVETGVRIFEQIPQTIKKRFGTEPMVGRSYGYTAPSEDPAEVLDTIMEAADAAGCADRISLALDCASSEMYDSNGGTYLLKGERVTSDELIDYVRELTDSFDFVFIEDLLDENDWDSFPKAVKRIPKTNIIGDDFIVTNRKRIEQAYEMGGIGGFILKPNQVGTITEALDTYRFAHDHELLAITSGRSGGVIDDVVMDLAVGLQLPFIKNGAPRSGERIEKLNFLMRACSLTEGCRMSDISRYIRFSR